MKALSLLKLLTLLGLSTAPAAGRSLAEIAKSLGADLQPQLERPKLLEALADLTSSGLIVETPRGKGQKSTRWKLEPPGQDALDQALGGFPLKKRGALGKAARLLVAGRAFSLPAKSARTAAETPEGLLACCLAEQLGMPFDESTTLSSLARVVAARLLAAENTQPSGLWQAALRRALTGETPSPPPSAPPSAPEPSRPAAASFAQQVQQAARRAPEGWFGPRKLFIHRAWEAWQAATGDSATPLPAFKSRLLGSLRAGELGLTRADFTDTLDPHDLEAAEIRDGTERFHFLTSERPSPTHS